MCLVLVRSRKLPTNVWAVENPMERPCHVSRSQAWSRGDTCSQLLHHVSVMEKLNWHAGHAFNVETDRCRQIGHRNVQIQQRNLL